jgi:hypothetical protein
MFVLSAGNAGYCLMLRRPRTLPWEFFVWPHRVCLSVTSVAEVDRHTAGSWIIVAPALCRCSTQGDAPIENPWVVTAPVGIRIQVPILPPGGSPFKAVLDASPIAAVPPHLVRDPTTAGCGGRRS